MSLINDALKRARRAQKPPSSEPSGDAPLQPVEPAAQKEKSSRLVPLLGLFVLILAGWFFWQWWSGPPPQQTAGSTARPTTNRLVAAMNAATNLVNAISNRAASASAAIDTNRVAALVTNAPNATATNTLAKVTEPAAVPTNSAPISAATNAVVAAASPSQTSTNPPTVPENTSAPPSVATAPATPSVRSGNFAPMKLQAIYYRLSKPSVLINNRTLFIGDEIEGARIVGIERYTVKLEMGGRTKDLNFEAKGELNRAQSNPAAAARP